MFSSALLQPTIKLLTVALVCSCAFSSEIYAQGTYEYHSIRPPGVLATVEIAELPIESVDAVADITFLDPADAAYRVSNNLGVRLSGVIDEGSQVNTGEWGELIVAWDSAELRPSWMEDFEPAEVTFSVRNGFNRGWIHFPGPIWGIGGPSGEWALIPEPSPNLMVAISAFVIAVHVRRRHVNR